MATDEELLGLLGEVQEKNKESTALETAASYANSFNSGIANLLGAPVDIINTLSGGVGTSNPVLGSQNIKELMGQLNIGTKEGEGYGHRAARIAGETALPLAGMLRGGQVLSKSVPISGKVPTTFTEFQKSLVSGYQNIFKTLGAESVIVAGGAGGGELAQEMYPDNEMAEVVGEMLSGVASSLTLSGLAAGTAKAGGLKQMFTEEGSVERAAQRVQESSTSTDKSIREVMSDTILDIDGITLTEDRGLASLMRAAMNDDHKLMGRIQESTNKSIQKGFAELKKGGSPDDFYKLLKSLRLNAANKLQSDLMALDTNATPKQISQVLRDNIEDSLTQHKQLENTEWAKLNTKDPVDLQNTVDGYEANVMSREITDDPTDYPSFIAKFLGSKAEDGTFTEGLLQKQGTVGNIKVLRSRIGQAIGEEKAKDAPNRNKIRLLAELDSSLLDDIEAASDTYKQAVAISKDINTKFRQGKIGKLMGYERTGELSTSKDGTLDFMFSGNKDDVRMGIRQLKEANPKAHATMGKGVKSLFLEAATSGGIVNPQVGRRFLKNNQHILDEFPEIQSAITKSIDSQRVVDEWYGGSLQSQFSNKQKEQAVAGVYLNAKPEEEIHSVLSMRSEIGQGKRMQQLVSLANQDKSGKALSGLKAAFGNYLIKHGTNSDNTILSGKKILKLLGEADKALKQLYSKDEITRLKRIGAELKAIELRQPVDDKLAGGKIINDKASKIISMIGGTFAARTGAKAGAGASGASMKTASFFTKEFNDFLGGLTNDRAREILLEAVEDKKLMKMLLEKPTSKNQTDFARYVSTTMATRPLVSREEEPKQTSIDDILQMLQESN